MVSAIGTLETLIQRCRAREEALLVKNGINPADYFNRPVMQQPQDVIIDEDDNQPVFYAYPPAYILGAPKEARLFYDEQNDDVQVYAYALKTQYCESLPNGAKNLAINSFAFQNMKHEAEKFDRKFFKQAQRYEDEEDDKEAEPDLKSDYNVEVKEAETVMLIYVRNKSDRDLNLSLQVLVADSNKNLKAPLNRIEEAQQKNRFDLWMVCHKVDPAQDWGDFKIEWRVNEKDPEEP